MTDQEKLNQFVNDVYLTRFNRFLDSLTDTEGLAEIAKTIRWANMFFDELERETDSNGQPLDWNFLRAPDVELATIATAGQVVALPAAYRKLVVNPERPLILKQGDSIVSRFETVNPNQITRRTSDATVDRVTVVGSSLVFSRQFKDYEIGAKVVADAIRHITRLDDSPLTVSALDTIKPYELLVLGVAKNSVLPDIVQGGLAPSFVQKYADLLDLTKQENESSSSPDTVVTDDYGSIAGVY